MRILFTIPKSKLHIVVYSHFTSDSLSYIKVEWSRVRNMIDPEPHHRHVDVDSWTITDTTTGVQFSSARENGKKEKNVHSGPR